MNFDALNKWLTLLANVGVISGLVLVALQMNLNTEVIKVQNATQLKQTFLAGELAFMGDTTHIAYAKAVSHPSKLTEAEMLQVHAYLNIAIVAASANYIAYKNGQLSDEDWAHAQAMAASNLNFRFGRMYWDHMKAAYERDFVKGVDGELAKSDPLGDVESWDRQILEEAKKLDRAAVVQSQTGASQTPSSSAPKN
jgi:hypothetical protein